MYGWMSKSYSMCMWILRSEICFEYSWILSISGWLRTLKYAELIGDDRVKAMKKKNKSQAEILYQLGYGFRRLHKNAPGGIYECNSRCSCNKDTCSNRVVQNGIMAQLQVSSLLKFKINWNRLFYVSSYLKLLAVVGVYGPCMIFRWGHSLVCIQVKYSPANKQMKEENWLEMNTKQIWTFSK